LRAARDMARGLKDLNFDLVVGIAERGTEIAKIFSQELRVPLLAIGARRYVQYKGCVRDIREFDDDSRHPNLTDLLIDEFMADGLSESEAAKRFQDLWKNEIEPKTSVRIREIDELKGIKNKSVLIVDEATFTGKTIREVREHLQQFRPRSVHALVILCGRRELLSDVVNHAYYT